MARAVLARLEREGKLDDSLRYEILNGDLVIQASRQVAAREPRGSCVAGPARATLRMTFL